MNSVFSQKVRKDIMRLSQIGIAGLVLAFTFQNCAPAFDASSSLSKINQTSLGEVGGSFKQCSPKSDSGLAAAHRVSNEQYNNIARDLLFITTRPADQLPSVLYERFDNEAEALANISANHLEIYWTMAETLANEAVAKSLNKIAVCIPNNTQTAPQASTCINQSIEKFALRAFRKKPSSETLTRLRKVYDSNSATFNEGFSLVVRSILSSPRFLYHTVDSEQALVAGIEDLDAFEMAARLSFFLWNTMPDDQLLEVASKDQLRQPEILRQQIDRMFKDPKISGLTHSFAAQWFGVSDLRTTVQIDKKLYPAYDDSLVTSAYGETSLFFNDLVINDRPLTEVLTSQRSYLDSNLAKVYGLPDPGPGFKLVNLPTADRRGLLTQASIMMADGATERTVPIHRGLWVMKRLSCNEPEMPNDALRQVIEQATSGKEYTEGQIRERLAEHQRVGPSCMACHAMMDPVGLAFEKYNPIGEIRTHYRDGLPVDSSGQMEFANETGGYTTGRFEGAVELSQKLATDARVHKCMSEHLFAYALQRRIKSDDRCQVETLAKDYVAQDKPISETIKAILLDPAFFKVSRRAP